MNSFTTTPRFDNFVLESLMGRLQIRPRNTANSPFLHQSLEDLLLDATSNLSEDSDDDNSINNNNAKSQLYQEEAKLEKEIIRLITTGKADSLKPNSGQAVMMGENHICVGFHEEEESNYRVWEWHGHIMIYDEENGYSPEYIYGNYFERLLGLPSPVGVRKKEKEEKREDEKDKEEEKTTNLGLRELIDGGDSVGARILHRIINAGPKV